MTRSRLLLALLSAVLLVGLIVGLVTVGSCNRELKNLQKSLDKSFPRVTSQDQRWKSIQITSRIVDSMGHVTAGISIDADSIEPWLAQQVEERSNTVQAPHGIQYVFDDIEVDFQEQWIEVSADYRVSLENPPLEIEGTVIGGIAGALTNREVSFFPAFTDLSIKRIRSRKTISGSLDRLTPLLDKVLRTLLTRLNGALNRDSWRIPINLSPIAPYDPKQQLAQVPGVIDVTGNLINLNFAIGATAILVDKDRLQGVTELTYGTDADTPEVRVPDAPQGLTVDQVDYEYKNLKEKFTALRSRLAKKIPRGVAWVAFSKSSIAKALNSALVSPNLCGSYDLNGTSVKYNVQVDTFKSNPIDCTPTRPCNFEDTRDCRRPRECHRSHDDRGCRRWFGNDPICELEKAAQNVIYEADYQRCLGTPQFIIDTACEAEKGAANIVNAARKIACEAEKSKDKLLCEGYKEIVTQVKEVANVSGDLTFGGKPRLCIKRLTIAEDLSSVTASGTVEASVDIAGAMRYIPLNIPSHLGCPAEWTRNVGATVTVSPRQYSATASLQFETMAEDVLTVRYTVPEQSIPAEMTPTPFEAIFARHPDLVVVCPGPAIITGAATLLNAGILEATGKDLVPELRGRLSLPTKEIRQELRIEPKKISIGSDTFSLTPSIGESAIEFIARRQ